MATLLHEWKLYVPPDLLKQCEVKMSTKLIGEGQHKVVFSARKRITQSTTPPPSLFINALIPIARGVSIPQPQGLF